MELQRRTAAGARWFASAGYLGSRTNNIWESTPLNNALFVTVNGAAPGTANVNARRPLVLADPENGKYYGAVDLYVTDGTQRYDGMLLSLRGTGRYGSTINANYALSHCYGAPDGGGGGTTNISTGYNKPDDPRFDDGNCTADRLHNFSLTASVESARLENAAMRAAFSGWRLSGSFRALTGPWLNVATGSDIAQNGQQGTQRPNQTLDDPYGDQSINPVNGGIRWLNPLAFAQPAPGTLRHHAAKQRAWPGQQEHRFGAVAKLQPEGEPGDRDPRRGVQRVELVPDGRPGVSLFNTATFGQITSSSNAISPRVLQFAVKYVF